MTVIELREKAVSEAEQARAIKDTADQEARGMTAEEALKFDQHIDESARLEKEAERQEKLEAAEKRLNEPQKRQTQMEFATGAKIETLRPDMYRNGKLRAFTGKDGDVAAYRSGKWILATIGNNPEARQWCRDHGIEIRAQSEGINTAGGFVVPDQMERSIIDLRESYGMFRPNARVIPMSSDHAIVPRRTGGVTAYFVGENQEITESEKSWNQVELTAKKLAALSRMSNEIAEDAIINMADNLADEMAWAFAKKEDETGLSGDGTLTYGGMVGIRTLFVDGAHTYGRVEGTSPATAWSHLELATELIPLMALLPTYAHARAKWYIHPAGKAGLFDAIALAAGGNTTREIAAGTQPMFAGYPVVLSSAMPVAPTDQTIAILFGDLSMATTIGDRRGITIQVTSDRYFENDQIGIKATERFCIVTHDIGNTTEAGPVVALMGNT
jgi:HK97 family phage major capsid protein